MLDTFVPASPLVDISDYVVQGVVICKRRAYCKDVLLRDDDRLEPVVQPVTLLVEIIPYACLPDGSYGEELRSGPCVRYTKPLIATVNRLVDSASGRPLATRYNPDGVTFRPEADWQADVQRLTDDPAVQAIPQNLYFLRLMGQDGVNIEQLKRNYIRLADAGGDLG